MNYTDKTLLGFGLLSAKPLFDSFRQSKTLLIMFIVALSLLGGLCFFLYKIAGMS